MIPISEINKRTLEFKVPAESIEKDYVISWVLNCFANSDICKHFIFYGGTAIKRIYFDEHRFSEDMDLMSSERFNLEEINQFLNLEFAQKHANLSLSIKDNGTMVMKDRIQLFINYSGYDEIVGAEKNIKVDFAMNRKLIGQYNKKPILHSYSDLTNTQGKLQAMTPNSILANKISMLFDLTRNEPRDVYDIWFLLNRINKFDFDARKIANYFKEIKSKITELSL